MTTARGAIAKGRAAAERLMVDTCDISRRTGVVLDPNTGAETPTYTGIYEGKCRVQSRGFAAHATQTAEQRWDIRTVELHLPTAVVAARVDDRVTITQSIDPGLTGRVFRVSAVDPKTFATKQKVYLEEVLS